jgi:arylformamidase
VEIIDISVPIRPGMVVYEGDPPVHLEQALSIAEGASANVSRLDFGVHSGTHVDAPVHFIDGAPGADTLPLDVLVGPAQVVDATGVERVLDEGALRELALPDGPQRLIFKTPNSRLWETEGFTRDFVRMDGGGARYLIAHGIRLVGIDYLSIGDEEAHVELLRAGVVPLESLDLRGVEPGAYRLVCLPLRIVGSDGAPARAVLIRDQDALSRTVRTAAFGSSRITPPCMRHMTSKSSSSSLRSVRFASSRS